MNCNLCGSNSYTISVHFDDSGRKWLCKDCFVLKIVKEEECQTTVGANTAMIMDTLNMSRSSVVGVNPK